MWPSGLGTRKSPYVPHDHALSGHILRFWNSASSSLPLHRRVKSGTGSARNCGCFGWNPHQITLKLLEDNMDWKFSPTPLSVAGFKFNLQKNVRACFLARILRAIPCGVHFPSQIEIYDSFMRLWPSVAVVEPSTHSSIYMMRPSYPSQFRLNWDGIWAFSLVRNLSHQFQRRRARAALYQMGSSHSKSKGFKASTTVEEPATVTTVKKSKRRDHPLEWEVLYLRRCLLFYIPVELVDLIIDHAQYWPRTSSSEYKPDFNRLSATNDSPKNNSHWLYVLVDLEEREREIQEFRKKLLPVGTKKWNGLKFSRKEKVSSFLLPKAIRKVKKVVFRIWSHDQGWGAEPNEPHLTGPKILLIIVQYGSLTPVFTAYEGSFTWFEAAICPSEELKPGRPLWEIEYPVSADVADPLTLAPRKAGEWKIWHLQSNVRASPYEALHEIVWTDRDDDSQPATSWNLKKTGSGAGTGFVRSIQPRDVIAVVARARFPGWANYVRRVEVEMFYTIS
ncbi:uncharacterized protein LACBIDRAFT_330767 [Laccaria bicolor S238N-H82]|uniref:Predicted protein n=1 Tax=Laccaria bicolor (strain S238N-H82 / ATCC MYA-4686) TaxID=486041 RepID=B0DME1_LACBS|nr:uncharacterized protein LACBIDRAFT_330767 [Laccaria bicolor S238N-H82]EDR04268.1 predicted protein [Laccaria bicolor S238N-H82]|eukprot:XP_001885159.1 predicted protein [Laccaria bicolor S238N-H82]